MHITTKRFSKYTRRKPAKNSLFARLMSQHHIAIPVITFGVLMLVTGAIVLAIQRTTKVSNPNVVVISYDGEQQIVSSTEPTVESLLTKLDLKLNEGDIVEPALATKIQQDDFRINIYRAVPVEVVDGNQRTFAFSAAKTSRSVAKQAGLTLFPEDRVETAPVTDFVRSGGIGNRVTIERATPIAVNLYGTNVILRTHANNVRELLAEKSIKLKEQDIVKPSLDLPITPNMQLAVIRNGLSTVTVQEDIAMPVQIIPDTTLSYGVSAVRQQGSPGKRAVTYQVNTQNGVEVGRTPIQTVIIQQPVTQISVQGANLSGIKGDMVRAGIAPSDYTYVDYVISQESGWCPTKWQGQVGYCPPTYEPIHPETSGFGYGLGQATPAAKMAAFGEDWRTNPVTQLKWANSYAVRTYGNWANAYNFKKCVGQCTHPKSGASVTKRTPWW